MLIKQFASGIVRTFLLAAVENHLQGYSGGAAVQVRISKNGGSFALGGAGVPILLESGIYKYVYTTSEVDTLGPLTMSCRASGADPTDVLDEVVGFDPYIAWPTRADIENRLNEYGALRPSVSGRLLDVSATGEAGIDWANIGSPTTAQNLSATTISGVNSLAPPAPTTQDIWSYVGTAGRRLTQSVGSSTLTFTDLQTSHNEYGALRPSVSGRLLNISASGNVGIDWANIQNPASAQNLSATRISGVNSITANIPTAQDIWSYVGGDGRTIAAVNTSGSLVIADHVLRRGLAGNEIPADSRSLAWGVAKLVNRMAVAAPTLTVYQSNDTSALFTQTVTTSGGASPIIEVNTD